MRDEAEFLCPECEKEEVEVTERREYYEYMAPYWDSTREEPDIDFIDSQPGDVIGWFIECRHCGWSCEPAVWSQVNKILTKLCNNRIGNDFDLLAMEV